MVIAATKNAWLGILVCYCNDDDVLDQTQHVTSLVYHDKVCTQMFIIILNNLYDIICMAAIQFSIMYGLVWRTVDALTAFCWSNLSCDWLSTAWAYSEQETGLCSANHRPGYWSNLACDWLSTAWAYSEQETGLCSANHRPGYWSNLSCDWLSTAWAYSEQEQKMGPDVAAMSLPSKVLFFHDYGSHFM